MVAAPQGLLDGWAKHPARAPVVPMTVRMSMIRRRVMRWIFPGNPRPILKSIPRTDFSSKARLGRSKLSILVQNTSQSCRAGRGDQWIFLLHDSQQPGSVRRAICRRKAADV
ncbi:hypothetical protein [Rhizobium mongolense]|uniref:hypothetical protein n=1 Tax=Rhizobium mongolense TaxID=57676 RepID=UPI003FD74E78